MSKMIQIRNVPDDLHRTLKVRAAQAGMTLSHYLLEEIRKTASRPTIDELIEAVSSDGRVIPKEDSAHAVRAERTRR